jgi:hypothetical protein
VILLRWLFRWGIPILRFLETVAGFLKLVELCKCLVVVPCLASLVEVYGVWSTPWQMDNTTCISHIISAVLTVMSGSNPHMINLWN